MKVISKSLFLTLVVLPLMAGLCYCVLYSFGLAGLRAEGFTWKHYQAVFEEGYFLSSMAYSIGQALAGVVLSLLFSIVLFYLIASQRLRIGTVLYWPLIMPPIVVGFAFLAFWSGSGTFSRIVFKAGLIEQAADFPDIVNGRAGVGILMAHLFLAIPFFTINLHNIYRVNNIGQLRQLAISLGASKMQSVVKVELPVILSKMKGVLLLYFIFMLGAYEIPLLLGAESQRMLSLVVLDKLTRFDILAKPQAYAMASMYLLAMGISVFSLLKPSKKQAL